MEKVNKIIVPNPVVSELTKILCDLDSVIKRVYSVYRLSVRKEREYQSRFDVMQDDMEMLLAELKKYKNGEIQNN